MQVRRLIWLFLMAWTSIVTWTSSVHALEQAQVPDALLHGLELARQERYDEAIDALQEAVQQGGALDYTYHNLGVVYDKVGRYEAAINAFREAVRLDPDYAPSHYSLGSIYLKQKTYRKAIDAFRKTLRLQSTHAAAHYDLALAYCRAERLREAVSALRAYLTVARKQPAQKPWIAQAEALIRELQYAMVGLEPPPPVPLAPPTPPKQAPSVPPIERKPKTSESVPSAPPQYRPPAVGSTPAPQAASLQARASLPLERFTSRYRAALIIGNASYQDNPLRNPLNDANDMNRALKYLGFEVQLHLDVDRRAIEQAITDFRKRLRPRSLGLFYYAGHGIQFDNENYLIPIDAHIADSTDIPYEAVPVGRVLAKMGREVDAVNIVILDACRDNPYTRRWRSLQPGLAPIRASAETLIAYATSPDRVAYDGGERNGLYTRHLLEYIRLPGLQIEQMFKKVRRAVKRSSMGEQVPWDHTSLTRDVYLAEWPLPAR